MTKKSKSLKSRIMDVNLNEIQEYNNNTVKRLVPFIVFLTLLPIIVLLIDHQFMSAGMYLVFWGFCILLIHLFRFTPLKAYPLLVLYLCGAGYFVIEIYLSVFNSPNRQASILLGVFCIMPIFIIDKRWRVGVFCTFFYVLHTVLSFAFKGMELGFDDLVNCLCMLVLGLYAGNIFQRTRLELFEIKRHLIIEKETDALTNLANRRKLFERFKAFEAESKECPSGVLMMDIDHFKQLNDYYGHAAGDECLRCFGALLQEFEKIYSVNFHRYGGEEFVALVWNCNQNELIHIAEEIRVATHKRVMGATNITVSIGAVVCDSEKNSNYEYWVKRADEATYLAKANGRNRVELFQYQPNKI